MSHLERIQTGVFDKQHSVTLEQVALTVKDNNQSSLLFPVSSGVSHLDALEVDDDTRNRVLHGQKLPKPDRIFTTDPFRIMYQNTLLAIYKTHPEHENIIKPARVIKTDRM